MNIREAIEIIEDFKAMDDWTAVYCPPMHEALDVVVNEALRKPKLTWISCSERLPDEAVEVFVYLYGNGPAIAWVHSNRWYTENYLIEEDDEPTAWMPLPLPYRGNNK